MGYARVSSVICICIKTHTGAKTEVKYPLLRACSSSAALRAAGLHRTSSDPAYLHTTFIGTFKEKENVAISGIRTPKEHSGNGFTKNRDPGIRVYDPGIRV